MCPTAFRRDESTRMTWANFFAWLYHGSELSKVTIYQAPLDEVRELCGAESAGCYSPSRQILVFPGDVGAGGDADIGAHEYGHHIAANRRNDPWDANDWGTKRWATVVGVCSRVAAGTAFPGDEGEHYTLNTGEAFAEAYRFLNIQRGGTWANFPLIVDPSFAPTAKSLAAVLQRRPAAVVRAGVVDLGRPVRRACRELNAAVGPRAAIALTTAAGAPVRVLAAGTYAITVRDLSGQDNFHRSRSNGARSQDERRGQRPCPVAADAEAGHLPLSVRRPPTGEGSFTVGQPAA